jgi:predicted nuclease with TOPRIM domain
MSDNGTLRDHLADVINERNELLRKVELLEARIDVVTEQLSALWKVDND